MGQRTRNHLIEDESRLFFKKSLPKFWVCRDKNDDYGIDCEVEIFDNKGNSTGLVFWVQLKGTDSDKNKTIKSISFKNEKIIQFINYDIPVLIVRYSSHKKAFYYRWSQNITNFKTENKYINVLFFENNLWDETSHQGIIDYLQRQLFIKQGKIKFPIKTFVEREDYDENRTIIPFSNISIIKNCIEKKNNYFKLTKISNDSILQIKVDKDQIVLSFTDFVFARMKINFSNLQEHHYEELTKYILITFAQVLFDIGKNNLGNDVIFENGLLAIIKQKKDFIINILHHLIEGNYFEETLKELSQFFKVSDDDNLIEIIMSVILISIKKDFSEDKLLIYEDFLVEQLETAKFKKDKLSISTALYNLGNHFRSSKKFEISLKYYLEARKYNPEYKKQAYYYYEMAGVLFLLKKFYFASKFYSKSIELQTDYYLAKALLADSVMYLGDYSSAVNIIDQFLTENVNNIHIDEWVLKYTCLKSLLDSGYPSLQKRDEKIAIKFTKKGEFEKALQYDFLYDLAWFNLGVQESKKDNVENAFIAFSFSALLRNGDLEAWKNATLCGLNEKIGLNLLVTVIRTAFFYNGQNYIASVFNDLKIYYPDSLDFIMELIDNTIEDNTEETTTIRYFENENKFTKIDLKLNS